MQNYYNNISTLKKVAFIDNIHDSQAQRISTDYPFAICFTSLDDNPVIWYNGKRYGLCKVSNKLISIDDNNIGLCINTNNEIELYISGAIASFVLTKVGFIDDSNNEYYYIDVFENNNYSIQALWNKVIFYYDFKDPNNNSVESQTKLTFTNTQGNSFTISNTSSSKSYIINITRKSSGTYIPVSSQLSLSNVSSISCDNEPTFDFKFVPEQCTFKNNGTTVTSINTYKGSTLNNIYVNFDSAKYDLNGNINVYYTFNNNRITLGNLSQESSFKLQNIITNNIDTNTLQIPVYIEILYNGISKQRQVGSLTININSFNSDVFYIGNAEGTEQVLNSRTISVAQLLNTSSYSNLRNTWLILPDTINFNSNYAEASENNKAKFKLQQSDVIIIPSNYKLTLPLTEDNSNINDNMFILNSETYTINDKSYKKYSIDQEYWNSTNGNVYFISLIEKIN